MLIRISKIYITGLLSIFIGVLTPSISFAESKLSTGIINYKPKKDRKSITGNLNCKGSTNVGSILKVWLPEFKKIYPLVKISMDFKGSSDGISSLMKVLLLWVLRVAPLNKKRLMHLKHLKGMLLPK